MRDQQALFSRVNSIPQDPKVARNQPIGAIYLSLLALAHRNKNTNPRRLTYISSVSAF